MRSYDFDERMRMSDGKSSSNDIEQIVRSALCGVSRVERAVQSEDRNGTDWWAVLDHGHRVSIDVKARDRDRAAMKPPKDDLVLETWSVVGKVIGWTLNPDKRTDYILWHWADTGRWCMVPFQMLRAVFQEHRDEWWEKYFKIKTESTRGDVSWRSEAVAVPRSVVWQAISDRFVGPMDQDFGSR